MSEKLIRHNRAWSDKIRSESPELAKVQRPEYLWIGCVDARVPANVIAGMQAAGNHRVGASIPGFGAAGRYALSA